MTRLLVLSEARALAKVPRMPPDRLHLLRGNRKGQYAVDLVHPHRLVFKPNHTEIPRRADGGIDESMVTAIIIVEIVDYH